MIHDWAFMPHPLVLGLFDSAAAAASAARDLRTLGVAAQRVSIVAQTHDEEGDVARAAGATPGSELEDSRIAGRLGELSAHLLAAVAVGMPGIGPIVADGPLAAGLGEAAGHVGGGIARALEGAGLSRADADAFERQIADGAILVGAHVETAQAAAAHEALMRNGARVVAEGAWQEG
jgi:hypothetical protein